MTSLIKDDGKAVRKVKYFNDTKRPMTILISAREKVAGQVKEENVQSQVFALKLSAEQTVSAEPKYKREKKFHTEVHNLWTRELQAEAMTVNPNEMNMCTIPDHTGTYQVIVLGYSTLQNTSANADSEGSYMTSKQTDEPCLIISGDEERLELWPVEELTFYNHVDKRITFHYADERIATMEHPDMQEHPSLYDIIVSGAGNGFFNGTYKPIKFNNVATTLNGKHAWRMFSGREAYILYWSSAAKWCLSKDIYAHVSVPKLEKHRSSLLGIYYSRSCSIGCGCDNTPTDYYENRMCGTEFPKNEGWRTTWYARFRLNWDKTVPTFKATLNVEVHPEDSSLTTMNHPDLQQYPRRYDIEITGAGISVVNGIYMVSGILNDKTRWTMTAGAFMESDPPDIYWHQEAFWCIGDDNESGGIHYVNRTCGGECPTSAGWEVWTSASWWQSSAKPPKLPSLKATLNDRGEAVVYKTHELAEFVKTWPSDALSPRKTSKNSNGSSKLDRKKLDTESVTISTAAGTASSASFR